MAKRKITTASDESNASVTYEVVQPKDDSIATVDIANISESVLGLLKVFSNCPELLINKYGGVYPPDCKLEAARSAILYKNPYYKSNTQTECL